TALTHEPSDNALSELDRVHDVGVQFAIDDFGTGYSSLARLRHLPVDQVKVDRTFVTEIDQTERWRPSANGSPKIVDAVIALATALDLRACGEGVETDAQLAYLRHIGCHQAQGFLISKPIPAAELEALLATNPQ